MPFQEVVTGSSPGHFVSLEGDSTAISEQLRLLPSSPDVLIFPTLLDAIHQSADDVPFNAHSFVRHVHKVVSDRVDLARSFLQSSTRLQPRLVLANGGCLTARSICLSTLSDNCTDGNFGKAEELFLDIVNDGVAGLIGIQEEENDSNPGVEATSRELPLKEQQVLMPEAAFDSAAVRIKITARRIASANHRHSPNKNDINLSRSVDSSISTEDPNARTTPVPLRSHINTTSDQECEFGARHDGGRRNVVDGDRSVDTICFRSCCHQSSISTFDDAMMYLESTEGLENLVLSPLWQENVNSSPLTAECSLSDEYEIDGSQPVEDGELMERVRSVGNILPSGPDVSGLMPSPLMLNHSSSAHCLGGGGTMEEDNRMRLDRSGTEFLPNTSYVRRPSQLSMFSRTEIKSPAITPPVLSKHERSARDLINSEAETIPGFQCKGKRGIQPFEPVFGISEDLIVLFIGNALNEIFEYVVNSYKYGSYPTRILRYPLDDSLRISALSFPSPPGIITSPFTQPAARLYSKHNAQKIYEVKSSAEGAVEVQNNLRALLGFPPFIQPTNPLHHSPVLAYNLLPKLTTKFDKCLGNIDGPIKCMLALGCEDGVEQHVYRKISEQIEKLWDDREYGNGIHVLDIRDPVLNVMEAFTSQSLSFQARGNPFSQPSLLAELIVPYLESYRSTLDPRDLLVLQYPASYFSTVIALRELLGSDALQVAGIIDVNGPSQLHSPRESSYPIVSSMVGTPARLSDRISGSSVYSWDSSNQIPRASAIVKTSFANADFLLPNTATEPKISTFLSNLYDGLAKNNPFYIPDAPLHASSRSSTLSSSSSHPPYTPSSPKRTFFSPRTESFIKMNSQSYLNSIWLEEATREKVRQKKQLDQDWENFYLDESEDEDELQSIFMSPLLEPNLACTNSDKARKLLGLT